MIDTLRLKIRKFDLMDDEFIYRLLNTNAFIENIGNKNINTLIDAQDYIKNGPLNSYSEHGYGAWLVELKNSGAPIGLCGYFKRDYLESADIGYAFLPEYWGKGYAKESAQACIEFGRNELDLKTVYGICNPDNVASIQLLEKIGLDFIKYLIENDEEIALYECTF